MEKLPFNPRLLIMFSDRIREFYYWGSARLAEIKLTPAQAKMLHFLADHEGLSQQDLATVFNQKPSTISELLTSMEEENLIKRTVNPKNKRMVFIVLSANGRDYAQKIFNMFGEYCIELCKDLSEEELKQLKNFLIKIAGDNPDIKNLPNY